MLETRERAGLVVMLALLLVCASLLPDACAASSEALLEEPHAVRASARLAADKESAIILLSFIGITSVYDVNFLIN